MDLARMQHDNASEGAVLLDDDEDVSSPSTRKWWARTSFETDTPLMGYGWDGGVDADTGGGRGRLGHDVDYD